MTRPTFGAALALAAAALAALPDPAPGCAAVPRDGQYVFTTDEAALVVWDEKTKTEHFVRRASFHSTAYDFGFLVPTPTRPALDLADDALFSDLSALTAAAVEYRTSVREVDRPFEFGFGCSRSAAERMAVGDAAPAARAGGVDVLEQKKLGDYDATVLRFRRGTADTPETGAAEVNKWLAKHGYEASKAIEAWLARYVKDEWCITAFKIGAQKTDDPHELKVAQTPQTGRRNGLRAKPVRMSFAAERPFYPYREPEAEPAKEPGPTGGPRALRVFVVAPGRYAGALGDGSKEWPGRTVWAGALDATRAARYFELAKANRSIQEEGLSLPAPDPGAGWWVTEFEDRSSPRPGTDEVYFAPSADPAPVARPPVVVTNTKTVMRTPWWHGAVYFGAPVAVVGCALAGWRLSRRGSAPPPT